MPRLTLPTRRTPAVVTPRREIAQIAVPVSAEFVLMLVLNFVNQVVVGTLGATAIAAVGFANSLSFILIITLGCLGTSVSILVARALAPAAAPTWTTRWPPPCSSRARSG
jgi:Na+-driven multidrug efflux pump